MNITYLLGTIVAIVVMAFGMMTKTIDSGLHFMPTQIGNFLDIPSILIVVGCTLAVVVATYPADMLKALPKHFKIMLNTKKFNPLYYVEQLVELAQVARKNGLLALEERANQQEDPFFQQAIMLIVDANDADKVRAILNNDIECMTDRHEDVAGMYDKASAVAPAFGMVGTLVGLINMLANMNVESVSNTIGADMGTALITTLYGCILAHVIFSPIANNLRYRDEQEVLCKRIIVEGIMSIQSGENPKALREKLLTFVAQQRREGEQDSGRKGKAARPPRGRKEKKR